LIAVLGAAGGCEGLIDQPGDDVNGDDDPSPEDPLEAPRFPRLTHTQWENTVQDLFYLTAPLGYADTFQQDPPLGRFDNNVARLTVTSGHWSDYQRAAELVAEAVTEDSAILASILPADTDPRAFIEQFGRRALRRPLSTDEIDRYAALFADGASHFPELADSYLAGVRLTIEAMLQSPHFLYRVEASSEPVDQVIPLTGYEMASRMSYAFWNTMPDDALLSAAEDGELDTAAGVREWAERMFDDPRTVAQFQHFHFQAFEMLDYADMDKDTDLFPMWRREIGAMMQTEANLFLADVVATGGSIGDFLTSNRAFVNDELAWIYGIEGDFTAEFVPVDLDPSERAGFLTRVGFLARNATGAVPDPIHRGVFVNLNLICRPISAVPNIPDNLMPVGDTNRERINSITGPGTCGETCHGTIINPIGFALENYDAIGQYRTQDNGFPVDAASTYEFEDGRTISFDNGIELSQALADAPEVHECYVQQMFEYIYGRDLTDADLPAVEKFASESVTEGLAVRDIAVRVVSSNAFRYRPVSEGVSP
jgi:hypothetical protein